jgi:hypothetical protein
LIDKAIQQSHQRYWLQFHHFREIDLRQPFLLTQSEEHDPLGARGPAAFSAVLDIITQQPGRFDELRNELPFEIE